MTFLVAALISNGKTTRVDKGATAEKGVTPLLTQIFFQSRSESQPYRLSAICSRGMLCRQHVIGSAKASRRCFFKGQSLVSA